MKRIALFCLLSITFGCNNKSQEEDLVQEIEKVKSNTIELHDVVMEDMGKLRSVKDSLLKVVEADSARFDEIQQKIEYIDNTDKAMWDWMHHFDLTFKAETDSATLEHFNMKYKGIQQVKDNFDSALLIGKSN